MTMIDQVILRLLKSSHKFSDLTIKEGSPFWIRVSGSLVKAEFNDPKLDNIRREDIVDFMRAHEATTGVQANKIVKELEATGDLDFAVRLGGRGFRGNFYYSDNRKFTIVMRLLGEVIPPIESLGVPPHLIKCLGQSKGLLLVTGATGSGKTTTLAAALEYINQNREGHIITLEDPIEYILQSNRCLVDQRQIKRDVTNFGHGLRSALRQDPDVILVGELRDFDTVKIALDAANTGHLVMGTLHTNSARQTIERITSFFSEDKQAWALNTLSQVVVGIASQVLVPRSDGNGRVMCSELMVGTPEIKACIREGKSAQLFNVMDTGAEKGHVLLNRALRKMVLNGDVTKEAALYATYDQNDLVKELKDV